VTLLAEIVNRKQWITINSRLWRELPLVVSMVYCSYYLLLLVSLFVGYGLPVQDVFDLT
jgi:hypothetical protein